MFITYFEILFASINVMLRLVKRNSFYWKFMFNKTLLFFIYIFNVYYITSYKQCYIIMRMHNIVTITMIIQIMILVFKLKFKIIQNIIMRKPNINITTLLLFFLLVLL